MWILSAQLASRLTAGPQSPTEQHGNGDCKRQETEAPSNHTTSASHLDLNFPLPGEKGPSCLVKVSCVSNSPFLPSCLICESFHLPSKHLFSDDNRLYQQIEVFSRSLKVCVVGRCTRTGTASNWTTHWRSTASSPSVPLSALWPMRSKTHVSGAGFPCGADPLLNCWVCVCTGTRPLPSWTRHSAWRRQRSRGCTARQRR